MREQKMKIYIAPKVKQLKIKLGSLLAVSVLAGCTTVGSDFIQPKVDVPKKWSFNNNDEASKASGKAWWLNFNDSTLTALISQAEQENLSLRQSALRIVEARAILGLTNANNLPNINLNGNASTTSQSEHSSPSPLDNNEMYSLGFDSSWETDVWGRLLRQRESANASHLSLMADYGDMLISVTAEVASNYIGIRTLQQRISLLKNNIELQERSLEIAQVWYKNGGRTELDLQQARALVFETRSQLPSLEQQLYQMETALAVLLGTHRMAILAKLNGSLSIPQFDDKNAANISVDLLRRRPDIRSAEYLAKLQNAELGVKEADYYPTFSLSGSLGYSLTTGIPTLAGGSSGSSTSDLLSSDALQYTAGLGFSWNIFNFERVANNVRAADARLQQAIEAYKYTVISAVKEAEDALVSLDKSTQIESHLSQSAQAYDRATSLALEQYKDGATDYQSVLDSLRQLVNVRQNQAQAKGQIALDVVSLYKAMGGGWELSDPISLNKATISQMTQRTDWDNNLKN